MNRHAWVFYHMVWLEKPTVVSLAPLKLDFYTLRACQCVGWLQSHGMIVWYHARLTQTDESYLLYLRTLFDLIDDSLSTSIASAALLVVIDLSNLDAEASESAIELWIRDISVSLIHVWD